jgi:adenosylhomocysteine nucleosidase
MRLLLVAAEARELTGVFGRCDAPLPAGIALNWARRGRLNGHDTLLVANGAGRARAGAAVAAARLTFLADAVVSTGLCGALDASLGVADVVVCTDVLDGPQRFAAGVVSGGGRSRRGAIYTLGHVASTAAEKSALRQTGAVAVEMEAAGVAEEAAKWGVPFYCVRAVSDLAQESFANDLNAALRRDGHFDTMHILKNCLRQPMVRVPELLQLRNRSIRAARALGEFFADCRF